MISCSLHPLLKSYGKISDPNIKNRIFLREERIARQGYREDRMGREKNPAFP